MTIELENIVLFDLQPTMGEPGVAANDIVATRLRLSPDRRICILPIMLRLPRKRVYFSDRFVGRTNNIFVELLE